MDFNRVIYKVEGAIASITLNYPKNLNAFDEAMADEVLYALSQAEEDKSVRLIMIKGAGRAFSAGGDIGYFYEVINSGGEVSLDTLLGKVEEIGIKMKESSKLILTVVGGVAAGAGASIALAGDFVICSDKASFILAFVKLGLVPDSGITYQLAKSIGVNRAMDMAMTGRAMSAREARDLGLVYKLASEEELEETALTLARDFAKGPILAYKNIKRQIYGAAFRDYKEWLERFELPTARECVATEDFAEGVRAFVEKRQANFQGR